mmetsp:Transcript_132225/g.382266  ORF Transcript_132225/g.382266 Transcript_132225/m.382266 type:complete len:252 (+) Transcript_132225:483-1238(+)
MDRIKLRPGLRLQNSCDAKVQEELHHISVPSLRRRMHTRPTCLRRRILVGPRFQQCLNQLNMAVRSGSVYDCKTLACSHTDVCAQVQEVSHDLEYSLLGSEHEGRLAVVCPLFSVAPCIEEALHGSDVALERCAMQRGQPVLTIDGILVRLRLQQQAEDVGFTARRGDVQRRLALDAGMQIATSGDERPDDLDLALVGSDHQGGLAIGVRRIRVGHRLQEALHHLDVAATGRMHQWSQAVGVRRRHGAIPS